MVPFKLHDMSQSPRPKVYQNSREPRMSYVSGDVLNSEKDSKYKPRDHISFSVFDLGTRSIHHRTDVNVVPDERPNLWFGMRERGTGRYTRPAFFCSDGHVVSLVGKLWLSVGR